MKDAYTFQPEQGHGLAFHAAAILVLALAGAVGLWQAAHATIGPVFLAYLLPALFALGLSPALVYRAYALYRANYELLRDGIRLRWGLRAVDIPMDAVSWVRPAGELDQALPLPWLRWPGAILGTRHLPGGGQVEFLASVPDRLVLISTPERIYAVSPDDPETFLRTFRRFTELGSLTPLPARSIYPGFLLARVWDALPARVLLLCALFFSLLLLVWVSLEIPSRSRLFLGFDAQGNPRDQVPPVQLLLLPVLNTLILLADFSLGLFFFRRKESELLAYILWAGSALSPLLFLIGVYFTLRAG